MGLDIESLIISPQENYLAVATRYTVHVCLLPDSSHLTSPDTEALKPRFFQLGPTLHVTTKSPLASVIFHPLGVNGSCLVTVAEDANVRVWEFNPTDRWTFDSPTVSIDLKKLADGTSMDQDFSASTAGTSAAFSPDAIEMQVASACFPSRGSGGWSSMTLWVAMCEGDVYALCPLLPNKWAPPPALVPSLSVSIVSNLAAIEDDPEVSPQAKQLAQQQVEWMADLDFQEPQIVESIPGDPPLEVYKRPTRPGTIPKLQGPFEIELAPETDDDMDNELTDIFVVGQKLDTDALMLGEDYDLEVDETDHGGLSLSVVCLISTSGQLKLCLDMDGVEAQWLPPRKKSIAAQLLTTEYEEYSLVTFQTLDLLSKSEAATESWPMFSPDLSARLAFYITHAGGLTYVSLAPWALRLATELDGESAPGTQFRIDLLAKGHTHTERLYAREISDDKISLAAVTPIRDPDLGHVLLSATPHEPVCVVLETPENAGNIGLTPQITDTITEVDLERNPIEWHEPRPVFTPSYVFEQPSCLPAWFESLRSSKHRIQVHQQVRLSPQTLALFTEIHRILSEETNRINAAAAELFRKADSLLRDLHSQISKAKEIRERVEDIIDESSTHWGDVSADGEEENMTSNMRIETRIDIARERQQHLTQRMEALKRKISKAGGGARPLSNKERTFIHEVRTMYSNVVGAVDNGYASSTTALTPPPTTPQQQPWSSRIKTPKQRFEEAVALRENLIEKAGEIKSVAYSPPLLSSSITGDQQQHDERQLSDNEKKERSPAPSATSSTKSGRASGLKIPPGVRKQKMAHVMGMLERETALVEGVRARLEKLGA